MRITFFIQDMLGGGAQHMMINTANEFAERGHTVDLLVLNADGPLQDRVSTKLELISLDKSRSIASIKALSEYLTEREPDIFISAMTHSNLVSILAKLITPKSQAKIIVSERTFLSERTKHTKSIKDKILYLGVKILYRFSDKILGISKGVADDIQKISSTKKDKVTHIYNPVITNELQESVQSHTENPFTHDKDFTIITSGRLSAVKDHKTLITAFAQLTKTHSAQLVILGDGELKDDLVTLTKNLDIENSVSFVGFVPNSTDYFKHANLFVMTSLYEGFCNVLVEAILSGLPIVSTDCPSGPTEILAGGKYGTLTPIGDATTLTQAMKITLDNPTDKKAQHTRALDFTVTKICDEYESLFKELHGITP